MELTQTKSADAILERLRSAPKEARHDLLVNFIERQLLEILQWDESRRSELDRGFVAIGLDSLMVIELQIRLQRALKFVVPPDATEPEFELTSADDLADFLLTKRLSFA